MNRSCDWATLAQTALREKIERRQLLYSRIRTFFAQRSVAEVETPILEMAPNPSPYLEPMKCSSGEYLQSSPEFYMKRLLAAGSGDIFQICKAFRTGELGRWHRPEFSILEWYRVGFDLAQLKHETLDLLSAVGIEGASKAVSCSYGELFGKYLSVDPYTASVDELREVANFHKLGVAPSTNDRASWLEMLFSLLIEPKLAETELLIVDDFPKESAMLARLEERVEGCQVAARFELYIRGIELANAFWELQDPAQQASRFKEDLQKRQELGLNCDLPWPGEFLDALLTLPSCAGIAVGLDRLLAAIYRADSLKEVLLF